jgi:hypothetical protein
MNRRNGNPSGNACKLKKKIEHRAPEKDPRISSFLALVLWFSVFYPAVPGLSLQTLPFGSLRNGEEGNTEARERE